MKKNEIEKLLKKVTNPETVKRDGYFFMMPVGVKGEQLEVVFMSDDGTRGQHILFFYDGFPTPILPCINEQEICRLVHYLIRAYIDLEYDKNNMKEWLEVTLREFFNETKRKKS